MRFFLLLVQVSFAAKLADFQGYEQAFPKLEQNEDEVRDILLGHVILKYILLKFTLLRI